MKKMKASDLSQVNGRTPDNIVTFETVQGDENVLKAQVFRDGRKHKLLMLVVPEDNISDIQDDLIYNQELEMEHA